MTDQGDSKNQNTHGAASASELPQSSQTKPVESPPSNTTAPVQNEPKREGGNQESIGEHSANTREEALEDRIRKSDRWMIGLTALAVFAAITSAAIFGWQLKIMQGQLHEMRDEGRAWIAPRALTIDHLAAGEPVRLSVSIENSGHSPAFEVAHRFGGYTIDVGPGQQVSASWIKPLLPENTTCTDGKVIEGSKIIYPSSATGYADTIETLGDSPPLTTELAAGRKTLYMQGCFLYRTAGRMHRSLYCFFLIPNGDQKGHWASGFCPKGNDGD